MTGYLDMRYQLDLSFSRILKYAQCRGSAIRSTLGVWRRRLRGGHLAPIPPHSGYGEGDWGAVTSHPFLHIRGMAKETEGRSPRTHSSTFGVWRRRLRGGHLAPIPPHSGYGEGDWGAVTSHPFLHIRGMAKETEGRSPRTHSSTFGVWRRRLRGGHLAPIPPHSGYGEGDWGAVTSHPFLHIRGMAKETEGRSPRTHSSTFGVWRRRLRGGHLAPIPPHSGYGEGDWGAVTSHPFLHIRGMAWETEGRSPRTHSSTFGVWLGRLRGGHLAPIPPHSGYGLGDWGAVTSHPFLHIRGMAWETEGRSPRTHSSTFGVWRRRLRGGHLAPIPPHSGYGEGDWGAVTSHPFLHIRGMAKETEGRSPRTHSSTFGVWRRRLRGGHLAPIPPHSGYGEGDWGAVTSHPFLHIRGMAKETEGRSPRTHSSTFGVWRRRLRGGHLAPIPPHSGYGLGDWGAVTSHPFLHIRGMAWETEGRSPRTHSSTFGVWLGRLRGGHLAPIPPHSGYGLGDWGAVTSHPFLHIRGMAWETEGRSPRTHSSTFGVWLGRLRGGHLAPIPPHSGYGEGDWGAVTSHPFLHIRGMAKETEGRSPRTHSSTFGVWRRRLRGGHLAPIPPHSGYGEGDWGAVTSHPFLHIRGMAKETEGRSPRTHSSTFGVWRRRLRGGHLAPIPPHSGYGEGDWGAVTSHPFLHIRGMAKETEGRSPRTHSSTFGVWRRRLRGGHLAPIPPHSGYGEGDWGTVTSYPFLHIRGMAKETEGRSPRTHSSTFGVWRRRLRGGHLAPIPPHSGYGEGDWGAVTSHPFLHIRGMAKETEGRSPRTHSSTFGVWRRRLRGGHLAPIPPHSGYGEGDWGAVTSHPFLHIRGMAKETEGRSPRTHSSTFGVWRRRLRGGHLAPIPPHSGMAKETEGRSPRTHSSTFGVWRRRLRGGHLAPIPPHSGYGEGDWGAVTSHPFLHIGGMAKETEGRSPRTHSSTFGVWRRRLRGGHLAPIPPHSGYGLGDWGAVTSHPFLHIRGMAWETEGRSPRTHSSTFGVWLGRLRGGHLAPIPPHSGYGEGDWGAVTSHPFLHIRGMAKETEGRSPRTHSSTFGVWRRRLRGGHLAPIPPHSGYGEGDWGAVTSHPFLHIRGMAKETEGRSPRTHSSTFGVWRRRLRGGHLAPIPPHSGYGEGDWGAVTSHPFLHIRGMAWVTEGRSPRTHSSTFGVWLGRLRGGHLAPIPPHSGYGLGDWGAVTSHPFLHIRGMAWETEGRSPRTHSSTFGVWLGRLRGGHLAPIPPHSGYGLGDWGAVTSHPFLHIRGMAWETEGRSPRTHSSTFGVWRRRLRGGHLAPIPPHSGYGEGDWGAVTSHPFLHIRGMAKETEGRSPRTHSSTFGVWRRRLRGGHLAPTPPHSGYGEGDWGAVTSHPFLHIRGMAKETEGRSPRTHSSTFGVWRRRLRGGHLAPIPPHSGYGEGDWGAVTSNPFLHIRGMAKETEGRSPRTHSSTFGVWRRRLRGGHLAPIPPHSGYGEGDWGAVTSHPFLHIRGMAKETEGRSPRTHSSTFGVWRRRLRGGHLAPIPPHSGYGEGDWGAVTSHPFLHIRGMAKETEGRSPRTHSSTFGVWRRRLRGGHLAPIPPHSGYGEGDWGAVTSHPFLHIRVWRRRLRGGHLAPIPPHSGYGEGDWGAVTSHPFLHIRGMAKETEGRSPRTHSSTLGVWRRRLRGGHLAPIPPHSGYGEGDWGAVTSHPFLHIRGMAKETEGRSPRTHSSTFGVWRRRLRGGHLAPIPPHSGMAKKTEGRSPRTHSSTFGVWRRRLRGGHLAPIPPHSGYGEGSWGAVTSHPFLHIRGMAKETEGRSPRTHSSTFGVWRRRLRGGHLAPIPPHSGYGEGDWGAVTSHPFLHIRGMAKETEGRSPRTHSSTFGVWRRRLRGGHLAPIPPHSGYGEGDWGAVTSHPFLHIRGMAKETEGRSPRTHSSTFGVWRRRLRGGHLAHIPPHSGYGEGDWGAVTSHPFLHIRGMAKETEGRSPRTHSSTFGVWLGRLRGGHLAPIPPHSGYGLGDWGAVTSHPFLHIRGMAKETEGRSPRTHSSTFGVWRRRLRGGHLAPIPPHSGYGEGDWGAVTSHPFLHIRGMAKETEGRSPRTHSSTFGVWRRRLRGGHLAPIPPHSGYGEGDWGAVTSHPFLHIRGMAKETEGRSPRTHSSTFGVWRRRLRGGHLAPIPPYSGYGEGVWGAVTSHPFLHIRGMAKETEGRSPRTHSSIFGVWRRRLRGGHLAPIPPHSGYGEGDWGAVTSHPFLHIRDMAKETEGRSPRTHSSTFGAVTSHPFLHIRGMAKESEGRSPRTHSSTFGVWRRRLRGGHLAPIPPHWGYGEGDWGAVTSHPFLHIRGMGKETEGRSPRTHSSTFGVWRRRLRGGHLAPIPPHSGYGEGDWGAVTSHPFLHIRVWRRRLRGGHLAPIPPHSGYGEGDWGAVTSHPFLHIRGMAKEVEGRSPRTHSSTFGVWRRRLRGGHLAPIPPHSGYGEGDWGAVTSHPFLHIRGMAKETEGRSPRTHSSTFGVWRRRLRGGHLAPIPPHSGYGEGDWGAVTSHPFLHIRGMAKETEGRSPRTHSSTFGVWRRRLRGGHLAPIPPHSGYGEGDWGAVTSHPFLHIRGMAKETEGRSPRTHSSTFGVWLGRLRGGHLAPIPPHSGYGLGDWGAVTSHPFLHIRGMAKETEGRSPRTHSSTFGVWRRRLRGGHLAPIPPHSGYGEGDWGAVTSHPFLHIRGMAKETEGRSPRTHSSTFGVWRRRLRGGHLAPIPPHSGYGEGDWGAVTSHPFLHIRGMAKETEGRSPRTHSSTFGVWRRRLRGGHLAPIPPYSGYGEGVWGAVTSHPFLHIRGMAKETEGRSPRTHSSIFGVWRRRLRGGHLAPIPPHSGYGEGDWGAVTSHPFLHIRGMAKETEGRSPRTHSSTFGAVTSHPFLHIRGMAKESEGGHLAPIPPHSGYGEGDWGAVTSHPFLHIRGIAKETEGRSPRTHSSTFGVWRRRLRGGHLAPIPPHSGYGEGDWGAVTSHPFLHIRGGHLAPIPPHSGYGEGDWGAVTSHPFLHIRGMAMETEGRSPRTHSSTLGVWRRRLRGGHLAPIPPHSGYGEGDWGAVTSHPFLHIRGMAKETEGRSPRTHSSTFGVWRRRLRGGHLAPIPPHSGYGEGDWGAVTSHPFLHIRGMAKETEGRSPRTHSSTFGVWRRRLRGGHLAPIPPYSGYGEGDWGAVTSHPFLHIRLTCTTNYAWSLWFVLVSNLHANVSFISLYRFHRYFDPMLYLPWANLESTNATKWISRIKAPLKWKKTPRKKK